MSETRTTPPAFPPGRYGHRREGRRRPVVPIIVLAVVLAASVLVSIKLYQRYGQTDYQPQIVSWTESAGVTLTVKFTVRVPAGGAAECVLRGRDYGGNEVGRRTVVVRAAPGATTITASESLPTTKRASVGDVMGCQPAG